MKRADKVQGLLQTINKRYKKKVCMTSASEQSSPWMYLRRPTFIPAIDIVTNGGIPAGSIVRVWGERSAGKDLLMWRTIAEQQRIFGDDCMVAIASTDTGVDKTQGQMLGAAIPYSADEISHLEDARGEPFSDEELATMTRKVGEVVVLTAENGETLFDVIHDAVMSNLFSIIFVNSLGSILPSGEADAESFGDSSQRGQQASLNTKALRKINAKLGTLDAEGNPISTTVWLIDQKRSKMNASKWEDPDKPTGGNAVEHYLSLDLKIEIGGKIKEARGSKTVLVGKNRRIKVLKQKHGGREGEVVEFKYYFNHPDFGAGPDIWESLREEAAKVGLIQGATWQTLYTPTESGLEEVVKMQGSAKMSAYLRDNPDLFYTLYDEVMRRHDLQILYKEPWLA